MSQNNTNKIPKTPEDEALRRLRQRQRWGWLLNMNPVTFPIVDEDDVRACETACLANGWEVQETEHSLCITTWTVEGHSIRFFISKSDPLESLRDLLQDLDMRTLTDRGLTRGEAARILKGFAFVEYHVATERHMDDTRMHIAEPSWSLAAKGTSRQNPVTTAY